MKTDDPVKINVSEHTRWSCNIFLFRVGSLYIVTKEQEVFLKCAGIPAVTKLVPAHLMEV